jgi:hypothetical protein
VRGLVFFLMCSSSCFAQVDFWDEGIQPVYTSYASALNVARAENKPLMLFVTQKACIPCRSAWRVVDAMRQDRELGRCVLATIDASTSEAKALMVGKRLTPQIIVLDLRNEDENGVVEKHAIEFVDKTMVQKLLTRLKPRQGTK